MEKILKKSHDLFLQKLNNKDIVVDMTIGNGNDTLFLCQNFSFVYGFDIQQVALDNTREYLEKNNLHNYKLIADSHANIDNYINKEIGGAIFNLGYLPNGNKNITTLSYSTITALEKTLKLIRKKGIVVIVIYDGHEQGKEEAKNIENYLANLNQKEYDVLLYKYINQINNPPYLYCVLKK